MIATADSSINKAIWPIIKKDNKNKDKELPVFPKRVISKCPAIILAVSRTAKVPGRITFLIVSIQTIKGIRTLGVPCGTKWANMCWVWFNQPYNIKLIHKGKAKVKVRVKWLVLVKI